MIAFKWVNKDRRECLVRGVDPQHNLFMSDIFNTEGHSKYNTKPIYLIFEALPPIIQARITMLSLAKDEEYIESVGFNGEIDTATADYMYIYEEE